MAKRKIDKNIHDDENGASAGKKKKGGVIAFVICLLIALVIWTYAKNAEIKDENAQNALTSGEVQTVDVSAESVGE